MSDRDRRHTTSHTKHRRLSLAAQLMVLIGVLSLGPLLVTNYVGYERSRDLIEQLTQQSLRNAARVAASDTAHFVEHRRHSGVSLAEHQTIGVPGGSSETALYDQLRDLAVSQIPADRFIIVDADGRVLSDTKGPQRTGEDVEPALRPHIGAGQAWEGRFEDRQGESMYAAIAPVPATDWSVVAPVSEASAMAVLDDLKTRVFWMGSAFVLVVIVGMVLMVRKTIEPLRELVGATQNMARGELAQQVQTRGPREVAKLADVFNTMSRQVTDLHDSLEDRVEQRTSELRQNQAFSELLFDSMSENLLVIDRQSRIIKANDAARKTYGEDLMGKNCGQVFEEGDTCADDCPVRRAFETGEPVEGERVHLDGEHTEIMHIEAFPLPATDGRRPKRVLMMTRPITDEMEERATAAADEKVSAYALMAASVAHEIGNPLSSISAQLQLAKRKQDPEFSRKVLDIIDGEVQRINTLLRDVTAFAGRQSNRASLVYWNQIIEDAVRLLKHDPRGRFAEFDLDLADNLPPVLAGADRSFQVLLNLGINALQAMGGHGTLYLSTRLEGDQVVVCVADSGPGVPEELRDQIFAPYFTTKEGDEGTGLGLFISRRAIEQMKGSLELEADEDGGGARFVIRMPVAPVRTSEDGLASQRPVA